MKETCENDNRPKGFNELIRSAYFWKPMAGLIIGAIGGYLYYHFVGCASGSCGITSNPFSSTLLALPWDFLLLTVRVKHVKILYIFTIATLLWRSKK
ncbi:MAG: hypothetical protein U0Z17_10045 [Bacteroidales bacterium]